MAFPVNDESCSVFGKPASDEHKIPNRRTLELVFAAINIQVNKLDVVDVCFNFITVTNAFIELCRPLATALDFDIRNNHEANAANLGSIAICSSGIVLVLIQRTGNLSTT